MTVAEKLSTLSLLIAGVLFVFRGVELWLDRMVLVTAEFYPGRGLYVVNRSHRRPFFIERLDLKQGGNTPESVSLVLDSHERTVEVGRRVFFRLPDAFDIWWKPSGEAVSLKVLSEDGKTSVKAEVRQGVSREVPDDLKRAVTREVQSKKDRDDATRRAFGLASKPAMDALNEYQRRKEQEERDQQAGDGRTSPPADRRVNTLTTVSDKVAAALSRVLRGFTKSHRRGAKGEGRHDGV